MKILGCYRQPSYIYHVELIIKVMAEKSELILELFSGYANGIITDEECCDMIDLLN